MTTAWSGGTWGESDWGGINGSVSVTGVYGTGAIGTPIVTGTAELSVTGVAGIGAVGTVVVAIGQEFSITGVYGTGAIGTVTIRTSWTIIDDIQVPVWQNVVVTSSPAWDEILV